MTIDLKLNYENDYSIKKTTYDFIKENHIEILINIAEKITAIAIGAFAFYTDWELFVPFFLFGVCIGVYSYTQDNMSCHEHHPASSCAGGPIENLIGLKLPPIISTISGVAVTLCHIDHHASVFVPIIAVTLANWTGKTASHYLDTAYQKITLL